MVGSGVAVSLDVTIGVAVRVGVLVACVAGPSTFACRVGVAGCAVGLDGTATTQPRIRNKLNATRPAS